MVRFTYNWHVYVYSYICFRPGNPALGMKSDQVIVSLVGFHICMYYSCSCFIQFSPFNHTIIPHLYIFTTIFIVLPNSLGLMLFVCTWGIILCNAFENILLRLLPPHLPGVNWLSMWEKITFPMYRSWFHDLYRLHGLCSPQKPLYSLPEA